MATAVSTRMTFDEVRQTQMFRRKSAKLRLAAETYEKNGHDIVHATMTAFNCASEHNANILSYEVRKKLQPIFDLLYGRDERELRAELIALAKKQLASCEPGSVASQRFLSQIERLSLGGAMTEPEQRDAKAKKAKPSMKTPKVPSAPEPRVPEGCTPLVDAQGIVKGYRTPGGEYVRLSEVEAAS